MIVIIVRHGLSEANKAGIIGTDPDLAPEGKQQSKELAQRLKTIRIDAIYSSPLKRAIQTAQPVAKDHNLKIRIDNRVSEVGWGDFDGKPGSYFEQIYGTSARHILDSYDFNFHKYHGEDVFDLEKRVRSFVDDLRLESFKTVLVVCHGGTVRLLNYIITGQKIPYQPNAHEIHLEI